MVNRYTDGDVLGSNFLNALYGRTIKYLDIGGDGSDGALTISSGTINISGLKQYTDVSITGGTLNLVGNTIILCTGNFTMTGGTITSSTFSTGWQAEPGQTASIKGGLGGRMGFGILRYQYFRIAIGGGNGGDGCHGLRAHYHGSPPTQDSYGFYGGGGGGGAGYGRGGAGGNGTTDTNNDTSGGVGGGGGSAKYGLTIEAIGNISIGGTITLNGGNGSAGTSLAGDGGGAGGSLVQLLTLGNLSITGTINVAGGNGATSGTGGNGGGGAGGMIKGWYLGSLTDTGTKTVSGGAGAENGEAGIYEFTKLEDF